MTTLTKILFFTLVFAFTCNSYAQPAHLQLNKALQKIQRKSNFPGFSIVVLKYDSVLFSKGYGFADKRKKTAYTTETIQPMASVSKTFIALALIKAVEQGLFTLDTDINTILPFKVSNPLFPDSPITIRHLATHTSGLLDTDSAYVSTYVLGKKTTVSLKELLYHYYDKNGNSYSKNHFSSYKPGKSYAYSNMASSLAAYLIELKADMSFDAYTTKYIFDPLNMQDTHWFYDETKATAYATLYEIHKQSIPLYQQILNSDGSLKTYSCNSYPDGSLKSSANDLTAYLIEMMKGYFGKGHLLSKENFDMLFQKQFREEDMPQNMESNQPNKAIFWAYNRKGKLIHTGGDAGVSAFISFDPESRIGRIILMNTQLDGERNTRSIRYFRDMLAALDKFEQSQL